MKSIREIFPAEKTIFYKLSYTEDEVGGKKKKVQRDKVNFQLSFIFAPNV